MILTHHLKEEEEDNLVSESDGRTRRDRFRFADGYGNIQDIISIFLPECSRYDVS